jgi:hypothetical protein
MRVGFIQNVRCECVVVEGKVSFVCVRVGFIQNVRCEVRGAWLWMEGKVSFVWCEFLG